MDVGLSIKVNLLVSEVGCSASLASTILKAQGGDVEKTKAWMKDPKNAAKIEAMKRLASYGPSSSEVKTLQTSANQAAAGQPKPGQAAPANAASSSAPAKLRMKGYGFIKPAGGGKDVFVHQASIKAKGFRSLAVGEDVEFEMVQKDGRIEAVNVTGPNGNDVKGAPKDDKKEAPDDGIVTANPETLTKQNLPPATMFMPRGIRRAPPGTQKKVWLRPGAKKKAKAKAAAAAPTSIHTNSGMPPAKKQKKSRWG